MTMKLKFNKYLLGVFLGGVVSILSSPAYSLDLFKKKGKTSLNIDIREWNLTLDKEKIEAGPVKVIAINEGKEEHELVLIKFKDGMTMATGRIPVGRHGEIEEDGMSFGHIVGEIEDLEPGDKKKASFDLEPGRYAIVCNMLEREPDGTMEAHYSMGMHALLVVE